jgi:hypothetical protein
MVRCSYPFSLLMTLKKECIKCHTVAPSGDFTWGDHLNHLITKDRIPCLECPVRKRSDFFHFDSRKIYESFSF